MNNDTKTNTKSIKKRSINWRQKKVVMLTFIVLFAAVGGFFIFRSFAATPLPTGSDDAIIELTGADESTVASTDVLRTPDTLPFRLYGNGLAICGDYPKQDANHTAQYYSKQLNSSELHKFVNDFNKDKFDSLNQQYVSGPDRANSNDAETITFNTNAGSTRVTVFTHDTSQPPTGYNTAKSAISQLCAGMTQPYTPNDITVTTLKVDPKKATTPVSEDLPTDIQKPDNDEGETVHTQEHAKSVSAKQISTSKDADRGVKFYKVNNEVVQTVTNPQLPSVKYKKPTNATAPKTLSQKLKSLVSPKAEANGYGYVRFALFCPAGGVGCSPLNTPFYAATIHDMYAQNTGKSFDYTNISIIYGNQPASYYQSSDYNVAYQRVYSEMDARGLLNGNSPLELISGFSFGPRNWCGVGTTTTGFPQKAVAITDPSPTGTGVCAGNTTRGSGYELRSAAHELGHNLTLQHTTGAGQAGGIMGYDYICNWPSCALAAFQVPIVQNHPLFFSGPVYQGRVDAFARGPNKQLLHIWYDGYNWSKWQDLGGTLGSGPTVASWGPNRLDVFARDANGYLIHKWWDGVRWNGWETFRDSPLSSDPAAVSWGPGRIDVVARSSSNRLVHKWYVDGAGWKSGWEDKGGDIRSSPTIASKGTGKLDIFARGNDNHVYTIRFNSSWSSWGLVPGNGVTTDSPAAVSWGASRIDLFARGTNNQLYTNWYQSGTWNGGWVPLGGILTSAPGVASRGPGKLDVFVRGTDGALWHNWYDNGWKTWGSLGNSLTSAPASVSWD